MFGLYFFRDIGNGDFSWTRVIIVFACFIPVRFLLSLIVSMKADVALGAVTLSLDRVCLFLIWFLIIGRIPFFPPKADFLDSARSASSSATRSRLG